MHKKIFREKEIDSVNKSQYFKKSIPNFGM